MTKKKKKIVLPGQGQRFCHCIQKAQMDFRWQKLHDPSIAEQSRSRIIKHPLYVEILNKAKIGCELILP